MRILFLTQICPYPPANGGAIKTYNILKHLGARHDVTLLVYVRGDDDVESLKHLSPYCSHIEFCRIERSGWGNLTSLARSLANGKSFIISRDWRSEMQSRVSSLLQPVPDLIYADHLQMFQFVPDPAPCPVLLDEHNVEWRIIERFASNGRTPVHRLLASKEWRKLRSYELSACNRADRVLTVTEHDREMLSANGVSGDRVSALPIGVDTDFFRPVHLTPDSKNILTFGTMSWPPNVDAVLYFAKSIYPIIKQRTPDARFTIVGSNPPREILNLSATDPSISVTGYVTDLRPYAEQAAAFVVPLRIGSGMRVKILDAMSLGLPVVTTSVGCEGITLIPGRHALVADTPEGFADAVVRLLQGFEKRVTLASTARNLVENRYSWPPILSDLDRILASL